MSKEIVDPTGEAVNPFAATMARIQASFEAAQSDPRLAERRAAEEREQYLSALRTRCLERGVPAERDVRRWVFAEAMRGQAVSIIGEAMERRGDPREGRWSLVVLLGDTGVGKTAAMARAVARHSRGSFYALARDAARELVDRPRPFAQEQAAELYAARLREVDLLALDELGTEPPALADELVHLIVARCGEGRMTMLAANLDPEQFTARYLAPNARFASRMGSPCSTMDTLDGADFRAARSGR